MRNKLFLFVVIFALLSSGLACNFSGEKVPPTSTPRTEVAQASPEPNVVSTQDAMPTPKGAPTLDVLPTRDIDPTLDATDASGGEGGLTTTLDPCTLLNAADAERVLGKPSKVGELGTVGVFQECKFVPADDSFGLFILQVQTPVTTDEFERQAVAGAEMVNMTLEPVDNLGDRSYWVADILQVLKGDTFFQLSAFLSGGDRGDPALLTDLARKIIGLLP